MLSILAIALLAGKLPLINVTTLSFKRRIFSFVPLRTGVMTTVTSRGQSARRRA